MNCLPASLLAVSLLLAPPRTGASAAGERERGTGGGAVTWRWNIQPGVPSGLPILALAVDAERDRVAASDGERIWLMETARAAAPHWAPAIREVRDLAFASDGSLWIASLAGLWWWRVGGPRAQVERLATGEAARRVHRIWLAGDLVLAATDGGVYAGRAGGHWRRIDAFAVGVRATAGALVELAEAGDGEPDRDVRGEPGSNGVERRWVAWLAADGQLARVRIRLDPRNPAALTLERERPPARIGGQPLAASPVDLCVTAPRPETGGTPRIRALYPRHLASWLDPDPAAAQTEVLTLPPGASARRLACDGDALWLAHDHGISLRAAAGARWQRASPPAGTAAAHAIALLSGNPWAGTRAGLLAAIAAPFSSGSAPVAPAPDPPITAVHAAALRHLDLDMARFRRRFRALERRGWLPELSLQAGVRDDHSRSRKDDQSFVSGDYRFLRDHDRDTGREYSGRIDLSWELGEVIHPSEWDDLSREVRQLIALRDDVLDEIDQLYFERARVRIDWAGRPDQDPQRELLELRARELAAGIDAWTGGWFAARAAEPRPDPARPSLAIPAVPMGD